MQARLKTVVSIVWSGHGRQFNPRRMGSWDRWVEDKRRVCAWRETREKTTRIAIRL